MDRRGFANHQVGDFEEPRRKTLTRRAFLVGLAAPALVNPAALIMTNDYQWGMTDYRFGNFDTTRVEARLPRMSLSELEPFLSEHHDKIFFYAHQKLDIKETG